MKPWQGCSPRKSGLRGNALTGSGLGALFLSQLNLSTVPTASDVFPFPTLTRQGSGTLMPGEIPVSWYNVLAPQDTPAHEPTQCQHAPEGGAVPDQARSQSRMLTQSLTVEQKPQG